MNLFVIPQNPWPPNVGLQFQEFVSNLAEALNLKAFRHFFRVAHGFSIENGDREMVAPSLQKPYRRLGSNEATSGPRSFHYFQVASSVTLLLLPMAVAKVACQLATSSLSLYDWSRYSVLFAEHAKST